MPVQNDPEDNPNYQVMQIPIELGEYNIMLIGRDGKVLAHKVLSVGMEEMWQTKTLDIAVLNGKSVRFYEFAFDIED